jgi:hypothetical protein
MQNAEKINIQVIQVNFMLQPYNQMQPAKHLIIIPAEGYKPAEVSPEFQMGFNTGCRKYFRSSKTQFCFMKFFFLFLPDEIFVGFFDKELKLSQC